MAAATISRTSHTAVFRSVFPSKDHTTATPEATPNIGSLTSPGEPFGGFNIPNNPADEIARFNRAWSSATRFLTLPIAAEAQPRDLSRSPDAENALHFLTSSPSTKKQLIDWYLHEVSTHFRTFVLPELSFWEQPIAVDEARNVLSATVQVLQQAQLLYLALDDDFKSSRSSRSFIRDGFMKQIRRHYHVLVLHSLPRQRLQRTLACYLFQSMRDSLNQTADFTQCLLRDQCHCSIAFDLDALRQLEGVGLGGSHGERAFAQAVHKLLQGPAVQRRCFQVNWSGRSCVVERLRTWVHAKLVPALEQAVATLSGDPSMKLPVQQFVSAAVNSFGRSRVESLFDYVTIWPNSEGAVLDIKEYLSANGSAEKAHLCSTFSEQIQRRLFHAGATTNEILSVYISVIHVFRLLDTRGVLLEKVAIPIRNYLRSRDDTAATIAASFIIDVESGSPSSYNHDKVCLDIAHAVASSAIDVHDDRLTDWNDMEWTPDPIDAGPNYRSSKSDDIVAYVLGLFEPDDFVKAFSNALGLHLLQSRDRDFVKEIRIIELLKSRLDAGRLQHAEVMLKDMRESVNLNKRLNPDQYKAEQVVPPTPKEIQASIPADGITLNSLYDVFKARIDGTKFQAALKLVASRRNDLYFPKRTRLPSEKSGLSQPQRKKDVLVFETKILSSYFWPQLRDGDFKIPEQIKQHKARYEQAFSAASGQRRLQWKTALDTTNLELGFPDRTIQANGIEVWKATLIDAFRKDRSGENDPPPIDFDESEGISISELVDALGMHEDYVQGAVSYWMGRRVLYEVTSGKYAVLERLDMDTQGIEQSQLDIPETGAIMSEQAILRQLAPTFQTFLAEMLRNGGAKEIGGMMGITSILRMVLPTFTYGDNEVRWLLEDMESRGEVTKKGESWAVVK